MFIQCYIIFSSQCMRSLVIDVFPTAQTSQPKVEMFQELLSKYPSVFHPARSPKSLLLHWQLLKQYYLLEDQSGGFTLSINYHSSSHNLPVTSTGIHYYPFPLHTPTIDI